MKCSECGHDLSYSDNMLGVCPKCIAASILCRPMLPAWHKEFIYGETWNAYRIVYQPEHPVDNSTTSVLSTT